MEKQDKTPHIYSVMELTSAIKNLLEDTFRTIYLQGEISNCKLQSSGHLYFSLKDSAAQIGCAFFRADRARFPHPLKDGDKIIVRADVSVYPPKGNYQLIVREVFFVGLGELLAQIELLRQKLARLGWFAEAHKKPLPRFPECIGVVTSPTGAVIRDIIQVLSRRLHSFHLILNPVKVQGEGAAEEIAAAITQMNQYHLCDVMIVCRGGGSLEDLMPFNSEVVAEAIFKSTIPVISAVGHETDMSIADFVADVRAPTPSAAAEIVSYEKSQLLETLSSAKVRINQHLGQAINHRRAALRQLELHPLFTGPAYLLARPSQHLDDIKETLRTSVRAYIQNRRHSIALVRQKVRVFDPRAALTNAKRGLEQIVRTLGNTLRHLLEAKKTNLSALAAHLASINPKALLGKGYSILFSQKDGTVITSIHAVSLGDSVDILLADGKIGANIEKIYDERT
jgi:exodeoxyribonuclease VII large subunit